MNGAPAEVAADTTALVPSNGTTDRDWAFRLSGEISMANAFAKVATGATLLKLREVKEKKLYRALAGTPFPVQAGESGAAVPLLKGTWKEFCELLCGVSRRSLDDDLQNLDVFGAEALQGLSSLGVGARQLRTLQTLPDADRAALAQAAKGGDADALRDLVEDLIERNAKLDAFRCEAQLDGVAKDKVIAKKEKKITDLELRLERKFTPSLPARNGREQEQLSELQEATAEAWVLLQRITAVSTEILGGNASEALQTAARNDIVFLCQGLADLTSGLALRVQFEEMVRPSWVLRNDGNGK